ncbi:WD40-repeat-containing domain protein [Zychaea mexicana]|uniref:WD40-repeat-containing domain protein n=1 Tax=Zychaea mexicana TaxID=64656 RepID=UPI0022FEE528|nr:WD40-repeat-containing domain protein [Zychaea mexicana]KAI9494630.1 WD40-repeat-containing domain protein [Zychaea mexicana]
MYTSPLYDVPRVIGELIHTYYRPTSQLVNDPPELKSDAIRSMAWHPHRNIIAFADEHDAIYVYEREGQHQGWKREVLKHPFMRDITCIEWKKRARGTLAVGCRKGICLWNLGSESEQDSASMNYLFHPEHENISSIAWDPSPASHLLAAASGTMGTIVVYDTMFLSTMPLKRKGKGNLLLRWSPNGRWLYVATKSGTSRMWDTLDWTYKELNNPPGLWVQSACWAPDSRSLLLSMHGKSDVHLIYWAGSSNASEICHEKVYSALPSIDSVAGDGKCFTVGDSIKELVLCPDTGRRLAVIFTNSSAVALYAVDIESPLTLKNKSALTKM